MRRLICWLTLLFTVSAFAQSSDSGSRAEPPADADADAPAEPQEARPPASRDDDVFVPTEEIAADEEITFPVDI